MIQSRKSFLFVSLVIAALLFVVVAVVRKTPGAEEASKVVLAERAKETPENKSEKINPDSDNDGIKDWEEALHGTNPQNPDSDGDGIFDGDEIERGKNPLLAGPNDFVKTEPIKLFGKKPSDSASRFEIPKYTPPPPPVPLQNFFPALAPKVLTPTVLSVSPERVRHGDTVVITGANFTPTDNVVLLSDGPAERRFDGLSSPDGATLTFVYRPPDIKVMTEAEIMALPPDIVAQIETPLKKAGMTIADVLKSYPEQGITSESEFRARLESSGHKFEDVYHYFFVGVENANGKGVSLAAILHGLPKAISELAEANSPLFTLSIIGKRLKGLLKEIFPTAYAQGIQYGGGFFATVMICICNFDGWLDIMKDSSSSGGGSGLWKFTWGSRPNTGSGFGAGSWLGGYKRSGGTCSVGVRPWCVDIPATSQMQRPFGTSM